MKQVLQATDDTGAKFNTSGSGFYLLVSGHVGGNWTLQIQVPDGSWVDTDITFADNGVKFFHSSKHFQYRVTGGTTGAKAWIAPTEI